MIRVEKIEHQYNNNMKNPRKVSRSFHLLSHRFPEFSLYFFAACSPQVSDEKENK